MLDSLIIRDIVLIDSLELELAPGLCVLTGETGAGKSILLDALGLAIGARSERTLVRQGKTQGVVSAEFQLDPRHSVWSLLEEQGLMLREQNAGASPVQLVLRRVVSEDGRSRAFVNDQPVSVTLLSRLGDMLIEIHGQHDDRGLFNPAGHRLLLDAFGGLDQNLKSVRAAWTAWQDIVTARDQERAQYDAVREDEQYIRHNLTELESLNPEVGEEDVLATKRSMMMQGEKSSELIRDILESLTAEGGADATLRGTLRRAERLAERLGDMAETAISALERASVETAEAIAQIDDLAVRLEFDPRILEQTEERLFALRAAARKHQCRVDDLPDILADFKDKLRALDHGVEELERLEKEAKLLWSAFEVQVNELTARRKAAALAMDDQVNAELASLKLEKARFHTRVDDNPQKSWGLEGGNKIEFEVATNPGAPFGSLMKIASGGELSRFILALKVVLARHGTAPTLIFDEVDRGIGGAVAEAVGERLARLAKDAQVLVVTHSPQVAALGSHHWRIAKVALALTDAPSSGETIVTRVVPLDMPARKEEIARMLAGATITDEARAAANRLMQGRDV